MGLRNPPLEIEILLESNPLKSRILVTEMGRARMGDLELLRVRLASISAGCFRRGWRHAAPAAVQLATELELICHSRQTKPVQTEILLSVNIYTNFHNSTIS